MGVRSMDVGLRGWQGESVRGMVGYGVVDGLVDWSLVLGHDILGCG